MWFNTSKSVAAMVLLVSVKVIVVAAANAAAFIVICPHFLLSVTAVALLVACVTMPPSPVMYPALSVLRLVKLASTSA